MPSKRAILRTCAANAGSFARLTTLSCPAAQSGSSFEAHAQKFNGIANLRDVKRLRANCGFIEISRGGRLERCFFQIPSICRYLSDSSKANIMQKVSRGDNHQDKMLDFVFRGQVRYEEMLHMMQLNRTLWYKMLKRLSNLGAFFFLNALAINVTSLLGFRYRDREFATLQSMDNIILPEP